MEFLNTPNIWGMRQHSLEQWKGQGTESEYSIKFILREPRPQNAPNSFVLFAPCYVNRVQTVKVGQWAQCLLAGVSSVAHARWKLYVAGKGMEEVKCYQVHL